MQPRKWITYACSFACLSSSLSVSGTEFSWAPVGADKPHVIMGDEIIVPSGGGRVTLELRMSGWDPDRNGTPKLIAYQAELDTAGYTSGDSGSLSLPMIPIPCATNADCRGTGAACGGNGFCDFATAAFTINTSRPDFVLTGIPVITVVDITPPDFRAAGVRDSTATVADPGTVRYGATLMLNYSADARGTFTIGFVPGNDRTFLLGDNSQPILPSTLRPARIKVIEDCNGNGREDVLDISGGFSDDCDGNGVPDECQPDCNGNDIVDSCDISSGTSDDCDGNLIPDECEFTDCNNNGVADGCDIDVGTSEDCDGNRVPDECEFVDCNGNDSPDRCDILIGTSEDCDANGVPDECEFADCNENTIGDVCDIASGSSNDVNNNRIPDECEVNTIALVPVGAEGVHFVNADEILVLPGPRTVTLEFTIANWDMDHDGSPRLHAWQGELNNAGFTSGTSGSLSIPMIPIPCSSDLDCQGTSRRCGPAGECDWATAAFAIDVSRPDFIFAGIPAITVVDITPPNLRAAAVTNPGPSVVDPGSPRYAATLVLDVSADAAGTFTVGLNPAPGVNLLLADDTIELAPLNLRSSRIRILDDCNNNGIPDSVDLAGGASEDCNGNEFPDECDDSFGVSEDCNANDIPDECESDEDCNLNGVQDFCDLANGTSVDENGNGIPDECETEPVTVTAPGCRYLRIVPQSGVGLRYLLVTSPDLPCVAKYVVLDEGVSRLLDAAVQLPTVLPAVFNVGDTEVVPNTTYLVRAIFVDGSELAAPPVRTAIWGDVAGPFRNGGWSPFDGKVEISDVVAGLDAFRHHPQAPPVASADLQPASPDGDVSIADVTRVLDGFRHLPYPFAVPCQ